MFRNPTTDLIVVLLIVLLIFGPKRLPGLGRQLGQGIREFKDSITGDSNDGAERPELTRAGVTPVTPPTAMATERAAAETTAATPGRESAERGS